MFEQIIISGFGGQGALFAGQLLTYAGLEEGRHVAWLPSYGPEMRGGTARCTVTVSDEPIGSPITDTPSAVIALNPPSLEMFESKVIPGGLLIVNSSIAREEVNRKDIRSLRIPATDLARDEFQNDRMANMILLGALVRITGVVTLDSVMKALQKNLPERRHHLLEPNRLALKRGQQIAEEASKE
ncbi:MAG: 2-oxoacid:acceptor oxidoreductase family protein [Anaerolineae bacterium]|nr:2-oxoacid:acceptor oxidoreductase family protein [Anaerolineae bacterium]